MTGRRTYRARGSKHVHFSSFAPPTVSWLLPAIEQEKLRAFPVVKRFWIATLQPVQRRPGCGDLRVARCSDFSRPEAQLRQRHVRRPMHDPRGHARSFSGGDPRLVAAEGQVHQMVLQTGDAVLQEQTGLCPQAALQVELAVEEAGLDGIVERVGQGVVRFPVNELARVEAGITSAATRRSVAASKSAATSKSCLAMSVFRSG